MKTSVLTFSLFSALLVASCGDNQKPAEKTEPKADSGQAVKEEMTTKPDSAAQAKAWMEYATPGDMHKWMADQCGTWSGEIKMWASPDAPPTVTKGTEVIKMVLNGRYQEGVHKSDFNGMPFEGRSTMAYDNAKKIFISTWIDDMGTGILIMEGKMDDATKTLTLEGKQIDPATGKDMAVKEVCKFPDNKTQTMEMFCTGPDGKEMKTMEMTLTKK